MNFSVKALLAIGVLSMMTACDSGGGSGSSAEVTGSADFAVTDSGRSTNTCFSTSELDIPDSCSVTGTPSSQNYTATCSGGDTKYFCNLGTTKFSTLMSNAIADQACLDAGGTLEVKCVYDISGDCTSAGGTWTSGSSPADATECAAAGGTFYNYIDRLRGSMDGAKLEAGSNIITANPSEVATELGSSGGVAGLDNMNPTLLGISATATISNMWVHNFYFSNPSIYNFMSTAVQFKATSPLKTSNLVTIEEDSVRIYYR